MGDNLFRESVARAERPAPLSTGHNLRHLSSEQSKSLTRRPTSSSPLWSGVQAVPEATEKSRLCRNPDERAVDGEDYRSLANIVPLPQKSLRSYDGCRSAGRQP